MNEMDRSAEILAMMDAALVDLPSTKANEDFVTSIEDSANAEIEEDYRLGYITADEAHVTMAAFHKRLHPDLS